MTVGLDSATKKQINQDMSNNNNTLASLKHTYECLKFSSNRSELVGEKSIEDRQRTLATTQR